MWNLQVQSAHIVSPKLGSVGVGGVGKRSSIKSFKCSGSSREEKKRKTTEVVGCSEGGRPEGWSDRGGCSARVRTRQMIHFGDP